MNNVPERLAGQLAGAEKADAPAASGPRREAGPIGHLLATRKVTRGSHVEYRRHTLSTGLERLDDFLPGRGYEQGGITEIIGEGFHHVLAIMALAAASGQEWVASLSPAGNTNPFLLARTGGDLERCFFLVEHHPVRLFRAAAQVLASGLFPLVALHAGRWDTGELLLDPVSGRRLLGLVQKHNTALLLLLDLHPSLGTVARPCRLRLRIAGGQIEIMKCAGYPPGASLPISQLHAGPPQYPERQRRAFAAPEQPET